LFMGTTMIENLEISIGIQNINRATKAHTRQNNRLGHPKSKIFQGLNTSLYYLSNVYDVKCRENCATPAHLCYFVKYLKIYTIGFELVVKPPTRHTTCD
jgi:hypothetical protein